MYKKICIIAGLLFFIFPSIGFSSVRIELKNGSGFIANQYWRADGQICFYFQSGIVGIPIDTIHALNQSDQPYIEAPEVEDNRMTSADPSVRKSKTSDAGLQLVSDKDMDGSKTFDLKYYQKKNDRLKSRLSASLKQLRQASRERDAEGKAKARDDTRRISGQIYDLTDEVKNNIGALPKDWWKEAE